MKFFKRRWQSGKHRNAGENKQIEEIEGAGGNIVKDILERYSKTLLTKDKPFISIPKFVCFQEEIISRN
jgi:hypothetical protein